MAQHDSGAREFLAHCNRLADETATEHLQRSEHLDFFLPSDLVPGPVFHVGGKVVVNLSSSLAQIYDDLLVEKAVQGLEGWDRRWTQYDQVKMLKEGSLDTESLRRLMLLRVLGTQQEREGMGKPCMWCGRSDSLRATHLRSQCPVFYARWVRIVDILTRDIEQQQGCAVRARSDLETEFDVAGDRVWVAVVPDGDLEEYKRGRAGDHHVVFSWCGRFYTSGLWRTDWMRSPVPMQSLFAAWNNSTPVSIKDVICRLQTVDSEWSHGGHPQVNASGERALPLRESVLVSWLVRGCTNWRVFSSGPMSVDLPVWVFDGADEEVIISVCSKAARSFGAAPVYGIWVDEEPPLGLDVSRFDFGKQAAWTVGLPWGLVEPLRGELAACALD